MGSAPEFADICCDFDGVIHSYTSRWEGIDSIPNPPVTGAFEALYGYIEDELSIAIFSTRSASGEGIAAMKQWFAKWDKRGELLKHLKFPKSKPAAMVYLDDRGLRFNGVFPSTSSLRQYYKVWYMEADDG